LGIKLEINDSGMSTMIPEKDHIAILIDKLGQLYSFYENNSSGNLTLRKGVHTLIDFNNPNRRMDLDKLLVTLIDMRKYASTAEQKILTEAIELLIKVLEN
jgi:hypothetical protein